MCLWENCIAKATSNGPGHSVMFQYLTQLTAFLSSRAGNVLRAVQLPSRTHALTPDSDGTKDENEQNILRVEVNQL